jgi:hypothetical protein
MVGPPSEEEKNCGVQKGNRSDNHPLLSGKVFYLSLESGKVPPRWTFMEWRLHNLKIP